MHKFMTGGILLGLLACMLLAGCNGECPLFPSNRGSVAVPPPEPPATLPPVVRAQPPQPMEEVPQPQQPPVALPPAPPPVSVPPAVAAAIQDLGDKYPGLFTFDKNKGLFRFNADITFDSGSSVVKPDAKVALNKLAEILSGDQTKNRTMTIVGFTDSDQVVKPATIDHLKRLGKPASNQGLSEARAEAVAAVLKAGGVEGKRMTARGEGEASPVADNSTPAGKARNRRVEIYLVPTEAGRG